MLRRIRFCGSASIALLLLMIQPEDNSRVGRAQTASQPSGVSESASSSSAAGDSENGTKARSPDVPLRALIDRCVEAIAVGPLAPRSSDADFLRRVSLDLTGEIPSPQRTRQFLDDPSSDKRQRLVDDLLASPQFARHMAVQFNVLILERRTEKNIKQQDWERYLFESIVADKPLDQLFRELVYAEPMESAPHPAIKFILNRDAEPNAVTREFGRLAFGMDLQCAQCHNHPLIDDYLQSDYYGLFAFLNRTTTLTDSKTKLVALSEKAEGDVAFKSVFTGDGRENTFPRIPKGNTLFVEPRYAPGDEYQTKPEKDKAGVPKYSRREALAQMLRDSEQFQRNLANRLWLLVFGRGVVHPVDFHHSANPPNNPELLTLLAHELKRNGFQMRPIVREMVLSRVYQRTCDEPLAESLNFVDISARAELLRKRKGELEAEVAVLKNNLALASTAFGDAFKQHDTLVAERSKLEKTSGESRKKLDTANAAKKVAEDAHAKALGQAQAVGEASAKTKEVASKFPDDKLVAEAASKLAERAKQLMAASDSAQKGLSDKTAQVNSAKVEFDKVESQIAQLMEKIGPADKLRKLEDAQLVASGSLTAAQFELSSTQWRLDLCDSIAEYDRLRFTDEAKAKSTWQSIVQRWEIAGQVAPLKALSSEQLALGVQHASGNLEAQVQSLTEKIDKTPPDQLKNAADAQKGRIRDQLVQLQLLDQLRDSIGQFVTHYGGMPGEDFQATVNQALFFGNGTVVDSWLKPSGNNLANRLVKLDNVSDLADELYVSVFSRRASEAERQEIAELLKGHPGERTQAIGELIWALLSSNEFRFNH